jgi:hypothetical protein
MPRPVDHSLCRKLPLVARAFVLATCLGLVSCGTTFPNFSAWDEDLPPIHEFPVKRAPVVVHRGSIGLDTDSRYEARAREARRNPDLLWGAYHLCTGDGIHSQLQTFLKSIGYSPEGAHRTVVVLDLESCGPKRGDITVPDLASLARMLQDRTGVYPIIYVNPYQANRRLRTEPHSRRDIDTLSQCPLWTSSWTYHPRTKKIPGVPAWDPWHIWQYAGDAGEEGFRDGNPLYRFKYPRGIRGVGAKLEMNFYPGNAEELRAFLGRHSVPVNF